jgi:hypothetical protein
VKQNLTSMGRKGKTQKHTAKEIAAKTKAAKERGGAAGGGGGGMAARLAVMKNQDVTCEGNWSSPAASSLFVICTFSSFSFLFLLTIFFFFVAIITTYKP